MLNKNQSLTTLLLLGVSLITSIPALAGEAKDLQPETEEVQEITCKIVKKKIMCPHPETGEDTQLEVKKIDKNYVAVGYGFNTDNPYQLRTRFAVRPNRTIGFSGRLGVQLGYDEEKVSDANDALQNARGITPTADPSQLSNLQGQFNAGAFDSILQSDDDEIGDYLFLRTNAFATVDLNLKRVTFYAGPGASLGFFRNSPEDKSSGLSPAATVGTDIYIGKSFVLNGGVDFIFGENEGTEVVPSINFGVTF